MRMSWKYLGRLYAYIFGYKFDECIYGLNMIYEMMHGDYGHGDYDNETPYGLSERIGIQVGFVNNERAVSFTIQEEKWMDWSTFPMQNHMRSTIAEVTKSWTMNFTPVDLIAYRIVFLGNHREDIVVPLQPLGNITVENVAELVVDFCLKTLSASESRILVRKIAA